MTFVTLRENMSVMPTQMYPMVTVNAADIQSVSPPRDAEFNVFEKYCENDGCPRPVKSPWRNVDGCKWRREVEVAMRGGETYVCRFLYPDDAKNHYKFLEQVLKAPPTPDPGLLALAEGAMAIAAALKDVVKAVAVKDVATAVALKDVAKDVALKAVAKAVATQKEVRDG